jgi:RNA polymerase sigma factor (sigma-70 family)
MGPDDTDDLVRQLLAGDARARGRLLERLRPQLVLWCSTQMSAHLKSSYEPEDMAQEILLRVERALDGFEGRGRSAFYAWLYTLGRNCIRDHVDHVHAEKRRLPPPSSLTQTSPSAAARRREDVGRMMRVLDALEPADREIISLLKLEELTAEQVAELQQRSVGAVRTHLCRAMKRLKEGLDAAGGAGAETSGGPSR